MRVERERLNVKVFAIQLWGLLRPLRRQIARALGWICTTQMLAILKPYMFMYVLDGIAKKRFAAAGELEITALLMLVMIFAVTTMHIRKGIALREVLIAIEHDVPIACVGKLLSLPLVYHQQNNTGLVIGKVVRGVGRLLDLVATLLHAIFPLVAQAVVTIGILLWLRWQAAAVVLPVVVLFAILTARVKMRMAGPRMERHDQDSHADELSGQAITNVMTTQSCTAEDREMRAIIAFRDSVRTMGRAEYSVYDREDLKRDGVLDIGTVAVIYLCARAGIGDGVTAGALVFIFSLAERVYNSCYEMGSIFDNAMEAVDPVAKMARILSEPETVTDPIASVPVPTRFRGDVAFTGVTYRYKGTEGNGARAHAALSGVSLSIAAGEMIGVVGQSGGGKSTLVKLLMRFDDVDSGSVAIDGADVRDMPKMYRGRIGYVAQEVELKAATVKENIAYYMPDATQAEIERAAKTANAHDFIMRFPRGYDEMIGDRGLWLSGGQRQRIGVARAVLHDPSILIFDEATSHVDVVSEQEIQSAIDAMRGKRTVIIIAHRLSTVRNAHRIVVMEEGRIKEVGTHAELLRVNGMYHRLVGLQTEEREAVM